MLNGAGSRLGGGQIGLLKAGLRDVIAVPGRLPLEEYQRWSGVPSSMKGGVIEKTPLMVGRDWPPPRQRRPNSAACGGAMVDAMGNVTLAIEGAQRCCAWSERWFPERSRSPVVVGGPGRRGGRIHRAPARRLPKISGCRILLGA